MNENLLNVPTSAPTTLVLQSAATVAGVGTDGNVTGKTMFLMDVQATPGTSTVIQFYGAGATGSHALIEGLRKVDFSLGTGSTITNAVANNEENNLYEEQWEFDVADLVGIRANIQSISGGSVTITGNAILEG